MVGLMYIKHIWLLNYIFTDTYDYYKYDGKVNAKLDTFTKRKDRYFFHKLSTRYAETDILDFFVANFLADSKRWIGNLWQMMVETFIWIIKNVKKTFAYHFKQECGTINSDFIRRNILFDDGFSVT